MGISFPITRSMIDVHGGHLAGHNNPDGGVIFSFMLPIGADKP